MREHRRGIVALGVLSISVDCVEVTFPEREGGYLGGKPIRSELSSLLAGFS